MAYTDIFARTPAENVTARQKREEVIGQIIADAEQTSVALRLANVRRMNAYQTRLRLQDSFPGAFWLNGTTDALGGAGDGSQLAKDSAFKQTTKFAWTNEYITPDEIAVLAVMPDAWRDDSDIAWEELRTSLRTAFAKAIDRAIFWGASDFGALPATFGDGVIPDAVAAGNVVEEGTGVDLADDYRLLGKSLAENGYQVNSWVTRAAEDWRLMGLTAGPTDNTRIFTPLSGGAPASLYGRRLDMVENGTWDDTEATAMAGDFSQLHVGIRQDMTFDISKEASIHNPATGALIYNAYQQDGQVLRAVMRLGYVVTSPLKHLTGQKKYPFAVLAPEGS